MNTRQATPTTGKSAPFFNYEVHVPEVVERFGRLIQKLGPSNKRGTQRHDFEVDFAHALHELQMSPPYLQGSMFNQATSVVNALVNAIKQRAEVKSVSTT